MSTATVLEASAVATPPLEDNQLYEIVNGQWVEKPPMSAYGNRLAFVTAKQLDNFGEAHQRGRGIMEQLFLLPVPEDPRRQRRPDAAFVSFLRWPADRPLPHTDPWPVVPDLAVEVVSKSNQAEDILEKMAEYFQAGVQVVWVIYPRRQHVYVYESLTQVRILTQADELDGGAVLPGFRLPLASLFGPVALQP